MKSSKKFDNLTKVFKKIQEGNLSVYIETDRSKRYNVTCKDHHVVIHSFDCRKKAIEFCNHLDINIIAFVIHKL